MDALKSLDAEESRKFVADRYGVKVNSFWLGKIKT